MNVLSETRLGTPAGTTPRPTRRRRLFRWLRWPLLLLILLGLGLAANWWLMVGRWLESTDNAYLQGDIAVLAARIEGHVAAIRVVDHQRVAAGDPLIELDGALWRARLAEAEASLAEATAAMATNRQQLAQQRAQIESAEAQLEQARAEQVRALADARRTGELVGAGWTSRQANERAVADQRKADSAVAAALAQLSVARQQLDVLEAMQAQQEARRDGMAAAAERARIDLANTIIRAPFDGIVGNRAAQLGHFVRTGQQLIAVAPPPERQWVTANFKETQLPRFRPGQPVRLRVDAMPGLELHGRVDSLAPATGALFSLLPPENATGNFTKIVQRVPVRLVLDGEEAAKLDLLRPGLSVAAEVDTREDPTAPRGLWSAAAARWGAWRGTP
ncbi:HlyD family secretion protein [Belnapia rosea]|uniref:Membrane fusion protein, multidrug efflux system n=1 Tax=Belnapia rosea TaxID=938405 RepID=A0A1G6L186_9PROT|nr:HlyD family secretion protein [Belnapia rosea]SDB70616.1 membrane fusion protein, multidrug efflux system [Belnapia rosea]SDC36964.1 membrane fusion protein, multidrug efflux system [Belnapia rosea]